VRISAELNVWLRKVSGQTVLRLGRLVREALEEAMTRQAKPKQRFLRHAGVISGPPGLSSRRDYSSKAEG
jgi:hypothetical protein